MKTLIVMLFASSLAFSQESGLFLEGKMGLNGVVEPSINSFKAKSFGLGYKFSPEFGLKAVYNIFTFTTKNDVSEATVIQQTTSLNAVVDLTNVIDNRRARYSKFNVELHAGLGYTNLTSSLLNGNDRALSIIGGITPKIKVIDNLDFIVDTSLLLNESQHYNFDGKSATYQNINNSFTGITYNIQAGLRYTLSKY